MNVNNTINENLGIEKLLISKELWVPDDEAPSCFNCNKAFVAIIIRRHHCRMCGQVFCSTCCDKYIPGNFKEEKGLRLCEHCFQLANNYLYSIKLKQQTQPLNDRNKKKRQISPKQRIADLENHLQKSIEEIKNTEDHISQINLSQTFSAYEVEVYKQITKNALEHIDKITDYIFKQYEISEFWSKNLKSMIKLALLEVKTCSLNYNESININHYIKVKKIPFKDYSLTRYIRGIAFRKNVSHKKMMTTLYNPRILILGCSLEYTSSFDNELTSLDGLNKKERQYMHNIIKNIAMLKPSVIFVENTVSRVAQEMIRSHGITLIFKIKPHQIKRIARITNSKIIHKLSTLIEMNNSDKMYQCLGTCEKFSIQNYNNAQYYKSFHQNNSTDKSTFNFDSFDPSIMYLEGCEPEEGVCIVISGPSIDELVIVKKCLKAIMKFGRNLILEREIVFFDRIKLQIKSNLIKTNSYEDTSKKLNADNKISDLSNSQETDSRKQRINRSRSYLSSLQEGVIQYGDLNDFMITRRGLDEYLKRTGINYTKINLIPTTLDTYFDLSEVQYKKIKHSNFNRSKVEFLAQLCEAPQINKVKFYSNHTDLTLAKYFNIKASNLFTKCDSCHRPKLLHTTLFYHNKFCVKVTSEIIGPCNSILGKKQISNETSRMGIDEIYKDVMKLVNSGTVSDPNKQTINLEKANSYSVDNYDNEDDTQDEWSIADLEKSLKQEVTNRFGGFINMYIERTKSITQSIFKIDKVSDDKNDDEEKVSTYIQCLQCKKILTDIAILTHEYKEYSLGRFLEHMFTEKKNEESKMKRSDSFILKSQLPDNKNTNDCLHQKLVRIVKCDEILFKFNIIPIDIFRFIRNPEKELYDEMKQIKQKYEKNAITIKLERLSKSLTEIIVTLQRNIQALSNLVVSALEFAQLDIPIDFNNNDKIQLQQDRPNNKSKNTEQIIIQSLQQKLQEIKLKLSNSQNINDYEFHLQIENLKEIFCIEIFKIIYEFEKLKHDFFSDDSLFKRKKIMNFSSNTASKIQSKTSNDQVINLAYDLKSELDSENLKSKASEYFNQSNTTNSASINIDTTYSEKIYQEPQNQNQARSESGISSSSDTIITTQNDQKNLKNFDFLLLRQILNGVTISKPELDIDGIEPFYNIVPVYEDEPISLIACALNSKSYIQDIYELCGFKEYFQFLKDSSNHIDKKSDKTSNNYSFLLQKLQLVDETVLEVKRYFPQWQNIKQFSDKINIQENINFQEVLGTLLQSKYDEDIFISKKIQIYYPIQFEALRMIEGIYLNEFINSLGSSSNCQGNTGGKSLATFIKSFDNKFIIKGIEQREFKMFRNHALKYFQYISQSKELKYPSLLAKIYGMFEIQSEKGNQYYLVQENLFYGLDTTNSMRIYDLKGSEIRRYQPNEKKGQVLLDNNFRIDLNNEPLALQSETKRYIDSAIFNDTLFLSKQYVMDYSLLLVIDYKSKLLKMGIIDYVRMYTWDKKVEEEVKKVMTAGHVPTIINPNDYRERFIGAMSRYFMEVVDD